MQIRLGDETYFGPFSADEEGDIIASDGQMTYVSAIDGADVIARAMNWLAYAEREVTDLVEVKCRECDSHIIEAEVPRHGTDEERIEAVHKYVDDFNAHYRLIGPQIDKNYLDSIDEAYCGIECWCEYNRDAIDETIAEDEAREMFASGN